MTLQVLKRRAASADMAQVNLPLLPERRGMRNGERGEGGKMELEDVEV